MVTVKTSWTVPCLCFVLRSDRSPMSMNAPPNFGFPNFGFPNFGFPNFGKDETQIFRSSDLGFRRGVQIP